MAKKETSIFDYFRKLTSQTGDTKKENNINYRELLRDSRYAVNWFNDKLKELGQIPDRRVILADTGKNRRLRQEPIYGKMFLFYYDAKTKNKLKYFDRFPIVIPIQSIRTSDGNEGFIGLNLHYLSPELRVKFLDKLFDLTNNQRKDTTTKFALTLSLLQKASKLKAFKPCLKIYLTNPNHIESSMLELSYQDWIIVSLLPTEKFVTYRNKAAGSPVKSSKVWSDSRKKIK